MTTEDRHAEKDKLWGEIRQLVLDEGPLVEEIDRGIATGDYGDFNDDKREGMVATMVAVRCADIARLSEGPFAAQPLTMVFGQWAGTAFEAESGLGFFNG